MVKYETRADIEATAERVWEPLSAIVAWPQWLPTVTAAEALDGDPLAVGKRYRIEQPGLRPTVWTVTAVEAGSRFQWRARSPGMEMVADHAIAPIGDHAVRIHLSFAFKGPLGVLLGRVFGRTTRRYIETEARSLKRKAEAG